MLEQLGAVIGILFIFAKVVSAIKALFWAESTIKKLAYNTREDFIKAHVFEAHGYPLTHCTANQCASL